MISHCRLPRTRPLYLGRPASQTGQWPWQGRLRAEQNQANKSPRCVDQETLRKPSGIAENQAENGVLAESSSWLRGGSLQRSYSRFPGTPSATTMCSSVQITLRERASVVATFLFSLRENAKEPGLSYLKPVFPRWPCRFGMAFAHFPCKTQRFHRLLAETTEEPNG